MTNPADTVSVVVPTFNRAKYIGECLDSLFSQTTPALEIIVVDDGSEDETPQVLAHYGERLRVIRKANGGKPSAVNLGVASARGRWVWILDDDDVALPRAIEARLAALAKAPSAAFVYAPHLLGTDGPDGVIVPGRCNRPTPPPPDALFLTLMASCFFHLGTTLFTKDAFVALGGLDPALVTGEDYDFQIRLASRHEGTYCDEPVFVFRQHGGVRGPSDSRYAATERAAVFRRCSQAIGRKIRAGFLLGDFLVPRTTTYAGGKLRQALAQRAAVMANHGCIEEMLDDVSSLLDEARANPLTHWELDALRTMMLKGWAYEASRAQVEAMMPRLASFKSRPEGRSAILALATGVFRMALGHPGRLPDRANKAAFALRMATAAFG